MRSSLLITCFLVPLLFPLTIAQSCGKKYISCANETTYRTCWSFFGWTVHTSDYITCKDGTYCNQDEGDDRCLDNTTSVKATFRTATSTATTSACGAAGIRCLDTSIYQKCWWFVFWAKYDPEYLSCQSGYVCDQDAGCVVSTTTTVAPVITTPACGSYTIYCLNETTYQKCSKFLLWEDLSYVTCPDGTVCNANSTDGCTVEVTTTAPATSNSACGAKGIHCINDRAYQTCWYFLWCLKYGSGYTTCEDGTVCDQENGTTNCVAA